VRAGDIVHINKRERLFHAKVVEVDAGTLLVEPIERNISYRHVQASEISEHWVRSPAVRPGARQAETRLALDVPLAL
jgi:hypothetical protein